MVCTHSIVTLAFFLPQKIVCVIPVKTNHKSNWKSEGVGEKVLLFVLNPSSKFVNEPKPKPKVILKLMLAAHTSKNCCSGLKCSFRYWQVKGSIVVKAG
jgi:hypothetical protein